MRFRARSLPSLAILLGVLVPLALINAQPASAVAYFVNTTSDSASDDGCGSGEGLCSLREAIEFANINPGADTIVFSPAAFSSSKIIKLNTELPYFTDPDGVTVDGTLGGDQMIEIQPANNTTVNFGLVFSGTEAVNNVTVQNFTASGFVYDAIQVCPNPGASTCDGPVDGVTLNNVWVNHNTFSGIDIFGTNVYNIAMPFVLPYANGGSGVVIQSAGDLSGVHITGYSQANSGDGYNLSGGVATDISFSGGADTSGGSGVQIAASALSGFTLNNIEATQNQGRGVNIDVVGSLSNVSITGGGIYSNNGGTAIAIKAGSFSTGLFSNNTFDQNDGSVVILEAGEISDVTVQNNVFTSNDLATTVYFSADRGSGNLVAGNTITGNLRGIIVGGAAISGSTQVRITRNSISGSTYPGIDLVKSDDNMGGLTDNDPGDADEGPNKLLNYPEIAGNTIQALTGTTCAGCLVELFVADDIAGARGDGMTFLRDATADGNGNFSVSLCGLNQPVGTVVTATATDTDGNTSEFSTNYALIGGTATNCATPSPTPSPTQPGQTPTPTSTPTLAPTPTPTSTLAPTPTTAPTNTAAPSPTIAPGPRKQGDLNCTGAVDGADAIIALRFKLGLPITGRPSGCPTIASGSPKFGDVNCDGKVDPLDALAIVQFWSGATINPAQPGGCTALGENLPS